MTQVPYRSPHGCAHISWLRLTLSLLAIRLDSSHASPDLGVNWVNLIGSVKEIQFNFKNVFVSYIKSILRYMRFCNKNLCWL